MRITKEADYAIRIASYLANIGIKKDAKTISESVGVTSRFTLKILRKLVGAGIVRSFKGSNGGYVIGRDPSEISFMDIIECVDGPVRINKCLENEHACSRVENKDECPIHSVFKDLSEEIAGKLGSVTLDGIKLDM